ncbi:MAG TPA: sulfotransferase [Candidatus Obscuribacterales bacterium]
MNNAIPHVRRIGSRIARALFSDSGSNAVAPSSVSGAVDETWGLSPREEYDLLVRNCQQHMVPVTQPLVFISQIQRSGGTLLSQLFDHHPQCHAHPFEFKINHPDTHVWPKIDLAAGHNEWFRVLFEHETIEHLKYGYKKTGSGTVNDHDRFRFPFLPSIQKAVFEHYVYTHEMTNERAVFDCLMTSYFNAWLDNQNLFAGSKKYVTAFSSHMHGRMENFERFFAVYPDGYLIRSIRDPRSWWASAKHQESRQLPNTFAEALDVWKQSSSLTLELLKRYPDRTYLLTFEQLVGDTERTMRDLAAFLGIDFLPILTEPTFNGLPIRANSSFAVKEHGTISEPLERYKNVLSAEETAHIERNALSLYDEVCTRLGRS